MKPGFVAGICATGLAFAAASAQAAPIVFETSGADAASILGTVNDFRDALGTLNANEPTNFAGGRRQINWDGAPDGVSDPNAFPGDFFNANFNPRARGIAFSTPGDGFQLSSTDMSGEPVRFGRPTEFIPFSEERLFAPTGSNMTFVDFFNPANTTEQAFSTGLGIVFNDVELAGGTTLELFDIDGNTLFAGDVLTSANGGLSFLGVTFDEGELIARAKITTGNAILLSSGEFQPAPAPPRDAVVMDDFIFGEPVPISALAIPEPSSLMLLGSGIVFLGVTALRRRRGRRPIA